jgi:RNA methyltransferase, TrmH family
MLEISSSSNPRIKDMKKLWDRKDRDETLLFLIEGYRELYRAFKGGYEIATLFFSSEHFLKDNEFSLIDEIKKSGSEIIKCSKSLFEKMSYRDRPDGLIAIAKQKKMKMDLLEKIVKNSSSPFFLIAEKIEKPGNLGTILRSCDGARVDAVIVSDPLTDIYNPNVVRASIGTLFTQKVILSKKGELIDFLLKHKIQIVATTPSCDTFYTQVSYKGPVAIVVGTEQYGLSDEWLDAANIKVKIPMLGIADSLNVATATTIMLYEVLRQRS